MQREVRAEVQGNTWASRQERRKAAVAAVVKSGVLGNGDSVRLISVYRKKAKEYDRSALLLYIAGFRH
jgi:hypothetical protein